LAIFQLEAKDRRVAPVVPPSTEPKDVHRLEHRSGQNDI